MLSDFIPSDHLSWTGQVLDIEDGNVYSSVITLRGKRTLQIDTFKGSDIIKIDFWTRVEKAILIDGVA
ncbi:DUF2147 domain-containing protein [Pseudovibrio denitrificans]|uniref:DUF2147 domain-containing protein n=1 Tax=Pseudovibrio denitrificans TaxID=258256 RepID=UPI000FFC52BE